MLTFSISENLSKRGVQVVAAICTVDSVSKRRWAELEKKIGEIINSTDRENYENSNILDEYKALYPDTMKEESCPASHLLTLVKKTWKLPNINRLVDCYNLVSLQTWLSIGAHDTDYIAGNIRFNMTQWDEKYTPLGNNETVTVWKNEYVCLDEEKVLCRMDIKQCDQTKVTWDTKKCFIYVQWNNKTTLWYIQEALLQVCENIQNFCGGTYTILQQK